MIFKVAIYKLRTALACYHNKYGYAMNVIELAAYMGKRAKICYENEANVCQQAVK